MQFVRHVCVGGKGGGVDNDNYELYSHNCVEKIYLCTVCTNYNIILDENHWYMHDEGITDNR